MIGIYPSELLKAGLSLLEGKEISSCDAVFGLRNILNLFKIDSFVPVVEMIFFICILKNVRNLVPGTQ